MNVCHFLGKISSDLELKTITKIGGGSTNVCNFVLSVSRKFKKSNGELGKQISYLDMEIYDSGAALLCQHFKRGDSILINASARNDNYTNSEGKKVSKVRFRVENFEFLPNLNYEKEE